MAMYATIEPRLIALLNDASPKPFPAYPRPELPSLDHNARKASRRPPPLEPKTATLGVVDKRCSATANQNISFDRDSNDGSISKTQEENNILQNTPIPDRTLGDTSPQSLRKILDDDVLVTPQTQSSKRRQRTNSTKDEFVQLPQPPKKQKAAKQVVPPIIIGLFEPPPNAALFPPIASSSFHDSHGRNSLNIKVPQEPKNVLPFDVQPNNVENTRSGSNAAQKCVTRTRKKWTEEETNQLLLGVQAHGVGNWTKILQDLDFKFDGRRAVDLKDRFRTCCPTELRKTGTKATTTPHEVAEDHPQISKSSMDVKNDSDSSSGNDKIPPMPAVNSQRTRAHRKKLEDLAELGIKEPFKRSRRRERRPFSEQEDQDILRGFQEYGPAWARILKDPRFELKSRRPTDLRDRLRNKYPEKFILEDEGQNATKDAPALAHQVETINSLSQAATVPLTLQESLTSSKPTMQPPTAALVFKDSFLELLEPPPINDAPDGLNFDWADNITSFPSGMGEMDISRILLDDTWSSRKIV